MFSAVIYWALKVYFCLFFILYLLAKMSGSEPGIWWDITGIFSLFFFLVNLLWIIRR